MNLEDVQRVFGAVSPTSENNDNKNNLILAIIGLSVVGGIGYLIYKENQKKKYKIELPQ